MPAWLAAIPVIGDLFQKAGEAIDRNVTSDDERLKAKAELTALYVPVITAVMDAQKAEGEMRTKLAEIEAKSEHVLVWARRPIISLMAATNFMVVTWLWLLSGPTLNAMFSFSNIPPVVQFSFTFAALANGLDMGTRGIEKIVKVFKSKEEI